MRINKEGYPFIFIFFCIFLFFIGITLYSYSPAKIIITLISEILFLFMVYFFRDPEREMPADKKNKIFSPCDGTVLEIEKNVKLFNNENFNKISIFLSIFDVHINRSPIDGLITESKHYDGKFLPAFNRKAGKENERQESIIENAEGFKIFLVQITGILARRIKNWKQKGDILIAGEKIGIMKFGSRIDIYIPADFEIKIEKKQKVVAPYTILAVKREG